MATPTTLLVRKRLDRSGHLGRFVYSIPSVLTGSSSPRLELEIQVSVGTLVQVKFVMANNALVDLYFGSEDIDFRGTIAQVHQIKNVSNECSSFNGIRAIFENTDTPLAGNDAVASLYLEIDNLSLVETTGDTVLELIVQEGGITY